jgi:hypothetical protein
VSAGFAGWLALYAILTPPGGMARALESEEALATAGARAPETLDAWSLDAGERLQASAFRDGWSADEAFLEGERRTSFAWIEGPSASLGFSSAEWAEAQVALRGYPLDALAPLRVEVLVDGASRALLSFDRGWSIGRASLGRIGLGTHVLTLRPERRRRPPGEPRTLSLAVDAIAVGPAPSLEARRNRGAFVSWLPVGLLDRPVLVLPNEAPPPVARAWSRDLGNGSGAHGFGRPPFPGTMLLEAAQGLLAAAMVALLAGLPWAALSGAPGIARLPLALGASVAALVAVFASLRALGVPPDPLPVFVGLSAVAALPFARGSVRRTRVAAPLLALLLALVAVVVLVPMATRVVPPMEEQDLEQQATAHGLATSLRPWALTNRGATAFFAEPPVLNLWQAGTLALSGRLPRLAFHEQAALMARRAGVVEPARGEDLEGRPHYATWQALHRRFLAEPQLWPTRQVNVLLSATGTALLAWLAAQLAGSVTAGALFGLLLLSFPELLVRGAYGGHQAAAALTGVAVLALVHAAARPTATAGASALATLVIQKGLLVPAAWLLAAPRGPWLRRLAPLAGAALGMLLFAAWGLWIDSETFLREFVGEHGVRRFLLTDVRFAADAGRFYPSIPALWAEFARAYGAGFTLAAALLALRALASPRPAVRTAAAAVAIGAVGFSLTDWRQTKHLALLVPFALLAAADAWPRSGRARRSAALFLGVLIARNLLADVALVTRFESLRPSTLW